MELAKGLQARIECYASLMLENTDDRLLDRLQAASYALPVKEALQGLADDVVAWRDEGYSEAAVDQRIVEWMEETGGGFESWGKENAQLWETYSYLDARKMWEVLSLEAWLIACVKNIAENDEPIPFYPFSAGYFIEHLEGDPPLLVAVMTPLTDPVLAGEQIIEKHKKLFGERAGKRLRTDEVGVAKMSPGRLSIMPTIRALRTARLVGLWSGAEPRRRVPPLVTRGILSAFRVISSEADSHQSRSRLA